uniref:UTP23 small subunit processome component n=1 Tax=Microcebus murinus TaxID=30608 RepID=A0A8C5VXU3_MICMU
MVEEGNPHHYFVATQGVMPKVFDEAFFSKTILAIPEDHEASAESFCSIFFLLGPDHPLKHLHPE